jgi:hypothetical protein
MAHELEDWIVLTTSARHNNSSIGQLLYVLPELLHCQKAISKTLVRLLFLRWSRFHTMEMELSQDPNLKFL